MNLSLGIVGLPNVGKSTLFNALTKQNVLAANYPFATIDPNHGIVQVIDERLIKIAEVEKPEKVIHAVVEFVDIAGLVKGAAEGQGLGNQFLANIREVSALVHLVRVFKNDNITHVENSIDPKRDIEVINTELILKDLETLTNKIESYKGKVRANPKLQSHIDYMESLKIHLNNGKLAIDFESPKDDELKLLRKEMFLLTDKPVIYLANANESQFEEAVKVIKEIVGSKEVLPMDIKLEAELAEMEDTEREEFMKELEMQKTGLENLTMKAYNLLGLMSFFTSGPKETRAWTINKGQTAPQAAGTIHTDFTKHFIAADVTSCEDFVKYGGWQKAKEAGKVRLEGKNYIMQDGDVVLFKVNA